jgi:thiol:disulfide interchange protein
MEEGLKEAAHIYFNLEWDEMKALQLHREAIQLHRVGIRDTIMAYEYASEADRLDEYVFQEEKNAQELHKDVKEKENEAQIDKRESTLWGIEQF